MVTVSSDTEVVVPSTLYLYQIKPTVVVVAVPSNFRDWTTPRVSVATRDSWNDNLKEETLGK